MAIYGYFTIAGQVIPAYDPGLNVPCPICGAMLNADDVWTTSLMVPKDTRSYFYRVHRSCREQLNDEEMTKVDGLLIDAIYANRNVN